MSRAILTAILLPVALLTGCAGQTTATDTTPAATPATTPANVTPTPANVTPAALLAAVRAAIRTDHNLSVKALWTNHVPTSPRATAGPALANLRRAVAARRRRGIRIRLLSERFRILIVRLDPSYTRATATVSDAQHLRPHHASGGPLGRPITLNEHARLDLRRVGTSSRFVVWTVTATR